MVIAYAAIHQLTFPLTVPYRLSSGDVTSFAPFVVELRGEGGRRGWGEALIAPGYTHESVEGSWRVACELAKRMSGQTYSDGAQTAMERITANPGVVSALLGALDMLKGDEELGSEAPRTIPLLAPCQASVPGEIQDEVAELIGQGFRTLKVKVGFQWQQDLERVGMIQAAVNGQATLRLDANCAFNADDAKDFARRLDPLGIELFEQPCAKDEWGSNAEVAAVSTVPIMLDESIYGADEITRAASIGNVGFVKLKLKKIGSIGALKKNLELIRQLGMTPVLGDGVALEIGCWMEACVAASSITNAGEMNGFLKVRQGLFANPLPFDRGCIQLPPGYWPEVDSDVLKSHSLRTSAFRSSARVFHM